MVQYRRSRLPGGTYFFTVALADRRSDLLVREIDALRRAHAATMHRWPFRIDASVVLPEHLHAIWTLPAGDADYPGRWRAIKAAFVKQLRNAGTLVARNPRGEAPVWQRRFWEHTIRDEEDLQRHIDYIHFNPVKHGHADRPRAWPHSSIHRFIARGQLPEDWGAPAPAIDLAEAGEPG
jgi:putative transposase